MENSAEQLSFDSYDFRRFLPVLFILSGVKLQRGQNSFLKNRWSASVFWVKQMEKKELVKTSSQA